MQLLDKIIVEVPSSIASLSDKEIETDKTEKQLIERKKLDAPELDFKNKSVELKKETITDKNVPEDASFVAGQEMESVTYKVPVLGELFFFKELFPHLAKTKPYGLMFDGSNVVYKMYSLTKLEGNDQEIEQVKDVARREIESLQGKLDEFSATIKDFNERRLPEAVKAAIAEEKAKRKNLKDTEGKLKF